MAKSVFEIDTKSTCLFCLNPNCSPPADRNNVDLTTATALKMLFRYLGVDVRKVAASVSSTIFVNASTNFGVSLCDACFFLGAEFLELFQEFEKIRLKLEACTWRLHEFMGGGAKNGGLGSDYWNCEELHPKFVEELRREIFEKCFEKLYSSMPKIRLRRRTMNTVGEEVSSEWAWRKDNEWSTASGHTIENIFSQVERAESKKPVIDGDIQILDIPPVKVEGEDADNGAVWRDDDRCFTVDNIISNTTSEQVAAFSYPADVSEEATSPAKDTCHDGTMTKTSATVRSHKKKAAAGRTCTICQKEFSTAMSLTRHHRVHMGTDLGSRRVKSVRCPECPHCSKNFSESSALRVHKYLIHPVQMLSECLPPGSTDLDVTRALTNILGNLISAANTKDVSEISCPLCNKTYTQPPKLKVHVLQFHQDQVCQNIQSQKHSQYVPGARRHLEQESSSSNPISKKTIIRKQFAKEKGHKGPHRFQNEFKCELCGKIFSWEKMLKRHLQLFHFQTQNPTPIDNSGMIEYPSVIPFQFDDEFEGDKTSREGEEDPLGF